MTREQNFFDSFTTQLTAYSSWQNIPRYALKKLPLSGFPAFTLDLGKTKYTAFDPMGKAISGEQEFLVTAYFIMPHRNDIPIPVHSDITNLIEQFINNPVYIPPGVSFGDTYSIDRTKLSGAEALVIPYEDTRFQVVVSGKYLFTIF